MSLIGQKTPQEFASPIVKDYKPQEQMQMDFPDRPSFPNQYVDYLKEAQNQYQVDPQLLASLVAQETGGFNYQPVRGTSGERGITQIIPDIWAHTANMDPNSYGQKLETDPKYAILEAARILQGYEKQFPGKGLAAYNAGPNYEAGMPYMKQVMSRIGR